MYCKKENKVISIQLCTIIYNLFTRIIRILKFINYILICFNIYYIVKTYKKNKTKNILQIMKTNIRCHMNVES